jgi:hypothetical protein
VPSATNDRMSRILRPILLGALLALLVIGGLPLLAAPAAATPWTGPEPTPTYLQFFAHNSSKGVTVGTVQYLNVLSTVNDTQAPWTSTGEKSVAVHYLSVGYVVAPQLQAPLVLNGTIDATAYMNQSGSAPSGGSITVSVDEVAPSGALTSLGTGSATGTNALGPGGSIPVAVFLPGPTIHATVPVGDSLQFNITIAGNTAEGYGIWWGLVSGTYYDTTVSVPASSYLTVNPVEVLNSTGQAITVLPTTVVNTTVTVLGTVNDPLGAYDFSNFSVDFSVVSAVGTTVVAPTPMTAVGGLPGPDAPNGTYSLSFNYSVLAPGTYNFTVNATDNTNHNLAGQNTLPSYYGRNAFGVLNVAVGLPPVEVKVHAVDDHNVSLPGAGVRAIAGGLTVALGKTNATGIATFNLAGGATYGFAVTWEGIGVGTFYEIVGASPVSFTLDASVIYPTFQIVTTSGAPLPYPLVTVIHPNGTAYGLIVANGSGEFSLQQVPAANYTLTVVFEDSEVVSARSVAALSDGPIAVTVSDVYPLTVHTTTATGGALSGVFVAVLNATSGATVASGITGNDGTFTALVPAGSYTVTGDWVTTFDLTSLQQTVTTSVAVNGPTGATLSFSKAYPPFTSTTEFVVVVGAALLIVIIVLLVALLIRSRRRPPMKTFTATPASSSASSGSGSPPTPPPA